ncbi:MAG: peptidylprolyl isomerase [Candidatus Adiutrix sp.]|jgi:peptidyl-prolyl cis-trans isomerase C|nr:peptidylprolyl isomerase [Candidatus Adiutrix sp.]
MKLLRIPLWLGSALVWALLFSACEGNPASRPDPPPESPAAGQAAESAGGPAAPAAAQSEAGPAEAADENPVLATVNGQALSRQMLESQLQMVEAGRPAFSGESKLSEEERATEARALRLEVLNSLVSFELACQEALRRGYGPSEAEIEEALAALKADYEEPDQLHEALDAYGASEGDLRDQLVKTLALKKWQENDFLALIKVDDQEARRFYEAHQDFFRHGEQIRAGQIFLTVPLLAPPAEKQKLRAKARDILRRLRAGEDFGDLAVEFSEAPGAAETRGGLGWLEKGQSMAQFDEAVFKLEPGQVSELVETPIGLHIFKNLERRPAGLESFENIREPLKELLSNQKLESALREKMAQLYQAADIRILDPELKKAYDDFISGRGEQSRETLRGQIDPPPPAVNGGN